MKFSSIAALLLLLLSSRPAPGSQDEFDLSEIGKSAVPIVGYDDKTGWLIGGAGFLYSEKAPGINAGLFAISNMDNFHSATLNIEQRWAGPWSYALHLLGERAFDNYYGEGDLTQPRDPLFMRIDHFELKPTLLLRVRPRLRLGAFADFRSRTESGTQYFPNESSTAWGLLLQWDTRDKLINTRSGDFFQLHFARKPGDDGFAQAGLDLRRFKRLRRDLTLGSRFVAAVSLETPSYLFRYRLGGLDLLRGYKDNRFRGEDFFVVQEELRWILRKWLSVNLSFDLGGIRDEAFNQLKVSGQAGLRLGLPPDWGQKMRVDFGIGMDQRTFQIQFGEIF